MKLHELYIAEGEVIDARYLFARKGLSDQDKYDDALAQQQGMIKIDDEAWEELIRTAGFDSEEDMIDFLKDPDNFKDPGDITIEQLGEAARMAWARKGSKVVKKFRCTAGRRKGRIVSTPSQCNAPLNLKARQTLRKTRAAKKGKMARKARRTKRINPASRRVQRLNKRR